MSNWVKREFGQIASLSKEKHSPRDFPVEICVELEHISKETGVLLGATTSSAQLSTKNVFRKGNTLFGKLRPNLKKYIYCDFNGVCSAEIWVLEPSEGIFPKFVYYLVQQNKFIAATCVTSGSNMPRANWDYVSKVPFACPPMPEQKAITQVLQLWDLAIEKVEALIAAKEKQFSWLLRELISKKCAGNYWKQVELSEVCEVKSGQTAPQNEAFFSATGVPFIRVSSLDYLIGNSDSGKVEYIQEEAGLSKKMEVFEAGSLVFAKSGMSAFQPRIYKLKERSFIVSHLCALVPSNPTTGDYLEHYLRVHHPNQLVHGEGFPSIRGSDIKAWKVWLPPLQEQASIAMALNTAQTEIKRLKSLYKHYCAQKHGLMQKLLTGKWRVAI